VKIFELAVKTAEKQTKKQLKNSWKTLLWGSLLNCQLSITSLKSDFSTICEAHSDKDFMQSNHTSAAQHMDSSTPAHASDARELGKLKNNAEVVGTNGLLTKEIKAAEGEGVTMVLYTHSPPVKLTSIQGQASRGLVMASTGTSSSLMALWHLSMLSHPSSMTLQPTLITQVPARTLPPSTALWPTLTTQAPAKTSPPSTALQSTSTAPYVFNTACNLHQQPIIPLPCPIPLLHLFTNMISQHLTGLPWMRWHAPCSTLSLPIHSLLTTQKQSLKVQPQDLKPSPAPVSLPTTPPFQQWLPLLHFSLNTQKWSSKTQMWCSTPSHVSSPVTYPFQWQSPNFHFSSYTLQPYQDKWQSSEGLLLPVTVNNASNTALSMHNVHSISSSIPPHFQWHPPEFCGTHPPFQPYQDEQLLPKELPSPVMVDNVSDMVSSMHNIHSMSLPTMPPFQQWSFNFHSTYPSSDTLQPYQDKQSLSKEPPSPVTVVNTRGTSSSMHNIPTTPPFVLPCDIFQLPVSLHPSASTPSLIKWQCSSSPPTFHQLKAFGGPQLLRSWQTIPMVSNVSSLTYQPAPSQTPPSTNFHSSSCQQLHHALEDSTIMSRFHGWRQGVHIIANTQHAYAISSFQDLPAEPQYARWA